MSAIQRAWEAYKYFKDNPDLQMSFYSNEEIIQACCQAVLDEESCKVKIENN